MLSARKAIALFTATMAVSAFVAAEAGSTTSAPEADAAVLYDLPDPYGGGGEPSCQIFPPDNPWNTDVSNYPLHPQSDTFVDNIGRNQHLHPDVGTIWEDAPIGIPYVIVDGTQPKALGIGGQSVLVFKLKGSSGTAHSFGDVTCNGPADSVDALAIQRNLAALPVSQVQPCPGIGEIVDIQGASEYPWGDVDCDADHDTVDSLKILRFVAGLSVQQAPGCPVIGSEVVVTIMRRD